MNVKKFSMVLGMVLVVMGLLALIPAFSSGAGDLTNLNITTSSGLFLGFIPMNIVNKLALIAFGLAGIYCGRSQNATTNSVLYAQIVCVSMAVLAVLGIIPATSTLGGIWPLYGANIAIYGIVAVIGGYFGFGAQKRGRLADVHPTKWAA